MTDTIHIMLDLETWGTEPGCDIRSIGACIFDPETGRVQQRDRDTPSDYDLTSDRSLFDLIDDNAPFYVATDNPGAPEDKVFIEQVIAGQLIRVQDVQYPYFDGVDHWRTWNLKRDKRTVEWWNDPERAEAAKAFTDPVRLDMALAQFAAWLEGVRPVVEVGGGREFAPVALWSHGAHFDGPILAAVYAACGIPVPWHYRAPRDTRTAFDMAGINDHTAHITAFASGTYHHALDDAITQAKAVCAAYSNVAEWRIDAKQFNER